MKLKRKNGKKFSLWSHYICKECRTWLSLDDGEYIESEIIEDLLYERLCPICGDVDTIDLREEIIC